MSLCSALPAPQLSLPAKVPIRDAVAPRDRLHRRQEPRSGRSPRARLARQDNGNRHQDVHCRASMSSSLRITQYLTKSERLLKEGSFATAASRRSQTGCGRRMVPKPVSVGAAFLLLVGACCEVRACCMGLIGRKRTGNNRARNGPLNTDELLPLATFGYCSNDAELGLAEGGSSCRSQGTSGTSAALCTSRRVRNGGTSFV